MIMKSLKINSILFLVAAVGFTSCLKENPMNIDPSKGPANIIEFANTGDNAAIAASTYPRYATDLGSIASGKTATFNINVSYSGVDNAPQDITVTLGLDTAALRKFNTENNTKYVAPPAAIISYPASVVIKAGTKMTQVKATITNNASFDFNVNYALPLKILTASAGVISGNFGFAMYSFSARNAYDGVYKMEGTLTDNASATIVGWYPINMNLITYTGNSIALYDGINYTNAYGHPIKNGTSSSYYGDFSPVFYFDGTGKITNVTNYSGDLAGANKRNAVLDPTGVNKATFNADGSIQSFEVSYIMTQNGNPRTYFKEKFTYVKPR
jgi:hypothetical protein